MSGDVKDWSAFDVVTWLRRELGTKQSRPLERRGLDGKGLVALTRSRLRQWGVKNKDDILERIMRLKFSMQIDPAGGPSLVPPTPLENSSLGPGSIPDNVTDVSTADIRSTDVDRGTGPVEALSLEQMEHNLRIDDQVMTADGRIGTVVDVGTRFGEVEVQWQDVATHNKAEFVKASALRVATSGHKRLEGFAMEDLVMARTGRVGTIKEMDQALGEIIVEWADFPGKREFVNPTTLERLTQVMALRPGKRLRQISRQSMGRLRPDGGRPDPAGRHHSPSRLEPGRPAGPKRRVTGAMVGAYDPSEAARARKGKQNGGARKGKQNGVARVSRHTTSTSSTTKGVNRTWGRTPKSTLLPSKPGTGRQRRAVPSPGRPHGVRNRIVRDERHARARGLCHPHRSASSSHSGNFCAARLQNLDPIRARDERRRRSHSPRPPSRNLRPVTPRTAFVAGPRAAPSPFAIKICRKRVAQPSQPPKTVSGNCVELPSEQEIADIFREIDAIVPGTRE